MSKSPINVETFVKKGEPIERTIKRFSRKVKKEGVIDRYRDRMYYEKSSDRKRRLAKRRKAIMQKLKQKRETI